MDWTAVFTGLLVLVTFILVLVTICVARRQLQDARVLQRAYVSALPGGISTTTRGQIAIEIHRQRRRRLVSAAC